MSRDEEPKRKMLAVNPPPEAENAFPRLQENGWDVDVSRSRMPDMSSQPAGSYDVVMLRNSNISTDSKLIGKMDELYPGGIILVGDSALPAAGGKNAGRDGVQGFSSSPESADPGTVRPRTGLNKSPAGEGLAGEEAGFGLPVDVLRTTWRWRRRVLSPQELYSSIVQYFHSCLGVRWASLLLVEETGGRLCEVSARGGPPPLLGGADTGGDGELGDVLSEHCALEPLMPVRMQAMAVQIGTIGSETFLALPLVSGEDGIGILCLSGGAREAVYDKKGMQFYCTLAQEAAECLALSQKVQEIRRQTLRDKITGVYTRRYFEAALDREMSRASRSNRPLALAMLDVDHFKDYNDVYGHPAGDRALKCVADLIEQNIRKSDTLYRYGGDEFAIILPDSGENSSIDRKIVASVMERVRRAVEDYCFQEHRSEEARPISISAGGACYPEDATDGPGLVKYADHLLYQAKLAGGNCVVAET